MDDRLVLATSNGIVICTRQEDKWQLATRSLTGLYITCVAAHMGKVVAGTRDGIHISTDQGNTWQVAHSGPDIPHIRWLFTSPGTDNLLLAGTEPAGIFVSTDGGASWDACVEVAQLRDRYDWYLPYSPEAGCVRGFAQHTDRIYAAVEVGGVLVSPDRGQSWQLVAGSRGDPHTAPAPYIHPDVHSITVHPNSPDLVFAPTGGGFYRSIDGGTTWASLYRCYCRAVWVDPHESDHIILGPADGVDRNGRIEETFDGGEAWQERMAGLPASWPRHMVERFIHIDGELLAVLSNGDLLAASLETLAWQPILGEVGLVNAVTKLAF